MNVIYYWGKEIHPARLALPSSQFRVLSIENEFSYLGLNNSVGNDLYR